ncbi:hypothetical protein GUITHDRAFT_132909 [Guillardia theta CCMP2712]|uniref:Uncharacterized protein n=1 Tax=Guillardia theta (strain CCMP2712) TaxID=905079 RepID=L1JZU4_GUITC|nr:hypothetical protein GUITHDRAFT_132909 [Guillardia theta CCMP2712]EKX53877.1 hypothetical protein GUITHDRAFT_132909 [Guillardia theta CCMP2712]|eukprot:XP_005840857.1 hypothetical protein GUITHDRAFT_132909 [Guillardia theta CCMP2712]
MEEGVQRIIRRRQVEDRARAAQDGDKEAEEELLGLLTLPLERYVRTAVEEGVGRLLVKKKEGDGEGGQGSEIVLGRLKELAGHGEHYVRASVAVVLKSVFVLERAEEAIRLKSQGDLKEESYIQEECDMVKALASDDNEKLAMALDRQAVETAAKATSDHDMRVRHYGTELLCEVFTRVSREQEEEKDDLRLFFFKSLYFQVFNFLIRAYHQGAPETYGDFHMRWLVISAMRSSFHQSSPDAIRSQFAALEQVFDDQDIVDVLVKALTDPELEVRKVAAESLMELAEVGVDKAVRAFQSNINEVLELGTENASLGPAPSPGANETPEVRQWREENGKVATLQDENEEKSAEQALQEFNLREEKRRQDYEIKLAIQYMQDLEEENDWKKLTDFAFPREKVRKRVVKDEDENPDRRAIRIRAAECLHNLVARGVDQAAVGIVKNMQEYSQLLGMSEMLSNAASIIEVEQQSEVMDERSAAAMELGRMAEEGDSRAQLLLLEHWKDHVQALKAAGVFRGKLVSNAETLDRSA